MPELFLTLVAAHLLADFALQPDWMVRRKRSVAILALHALIVLVVTTLLMGRLHLPILSLVFFTHLAIDFAKVRLPDRLLWFTVDQLAHLAVIVLVAWYFGRPADEPGWLHQGSVEPVWLPYVPPGLVPWYFAALSLVSGLVLMIPVGGIVVGRMTEPFLQEIREHLTKEGSKHHEGLSNGGKFIGYLERTLTLLLILIHLPAGIGFLIAAKSILRFGEVKEQQDRMFAEYVLIGTLLSFTWALLVAIATQLAIDYWLVPRADMPAPYMSAPDMPRPFMP